ncbi:MAG TPA: hypothetical protein VFW23_01670 [Tepidisphaeraceae bacterium]|nr:hypothetical protein [Tepidisphaeraceae bacterium]
MKPTLALELVAVVLLTVAPGRAQTTQPAQSRDPYVLGATSRLKLAQDDYDRAREQCAALESVLRDRTGRVDVSQKGLQGYADHLQSELDLLTLQEIGSHARSRALEVAVASQLSEAEKVSHEDSVAAELQKLADAREKQMQLIEEQYKHGVTTAASIQEATSALADARAKLAERRQTVILNAGGDIVQALKRELLNLNIDTREREAKMEFLQKELARIKPELAQSRAFDLQQQIVSEELETVQIARHNLESMETHSGDPWNQLSRPTKGR